MVLLLASYLFYMSWIPQYGLLLLILTVVNYGLGIWISRLPGAARYLFVLGIAVNLLALCYYKYA
ncbi:MAG: hypothetical protein K8F91_15120, partial [Candidatus Obscuribacterales bacterium]|nr:hypothetical protein [Candidatus Obscuribacterales bacterium]